MNKHLLKRVLSVFLSIWMLFTLTMTVFAATSFTSEYAPDANYGDNYIVIPASPNGVTVTEYAFDVDGSTITAPSTSSTYSYFNPSTNLWTTTVLASESETVYPVLGNYIGLTQKFVASSISDSTMGAIWFMLYNPDGKLVSDDWTLGYNEAYQWSVFLPKAGTWRLVIIGAGTNAPAVVTAGWYKN